MQFRSEICVAFSCPRSWIQQDRICASFLILGPSIFKLELTATYVERASVCGVDTLVGDGGVDTACFLLWNKGGSYFFVFIPVQHLHTSWYGRRKWFPCGRLRLICKPQLDSEDLNVIGDSRILLQCDSTAAMVLFSLAAGHKSCSRWACRKCTYDSGWAASCSRREAFGDSSRTTTVIYIILNCVLRLREDWNGLRVYWRVWLISI